MKAEGEGWLCIVEVEEELDGDTDEKARDGWLIDGMELSFSSLRSMSSCRV